MLDATCGGKAAINMQRYCANSMTPQNKQRRACGLRGYLPVCRSLHPCRACTQQITLESAEEYRTIAPTKKCSKHRNVTRMHRRAQERTRAWVSPFSSHRRTKLLRFVDPRSHSNRAAVRRMKRSKCCRSSNRTRNPLVPSTLPNNARVENDSAANSVNFLSPRTWLKACSLLYTVRRNS